jgi:hypothetical protein
MRAYQTFVNIHKAAGPDRLPGRVLKACADQLSSIFTDIFNLSLTESVIPNVSSRPPWSEAKVTCLNDYRPVPLVLVAMKCFERLVMAHINSILPDTLDPLQFTYHPNRTTDCTLAITLHTALSHLDKSNTCVRMLFINYSSVFNTIVPTKFITKLRTLGLKTSLCNWILDFLTGRPQVVWVGNNTSADPQHWGPSGVCAVPPVFSVHTQLCGHSTTTTPSLSLLTTQQRSV